MLLPEERKRILKLLVVKDPSEEVRVHVLARLAKIDNLPDVERFLIANEALNELKNYTPPTRTHNEAVKLIGGIGSQFKTAAMYVLTSIPGPLEKEISGIIKKSLKSLNELPEPKPEPSRRRSAYIHHEFKMV